MFIKKVFLTMFLLLSMIIYGFNTPLIDAIYNHDWNLVDELLESDENLVPTINNETPLMIASEYGYLDLVKKLIVKDVDLDYRNIHGISAIHKAINYNQTEVVMLLIEAGADLEIVDNEGRTPLMASTAFHAQESFDLLLNAGVEIDKVDNHGLTALYHSIVPPIEENSYFVDKGKEAFGDDNFQTVNSFPEMTLKLLDLGSNMDFILPNGVHLFFKVCDKSSIEVIDRFLDEGFDINMKDSQGFTPIIYSTSNNDRDVLPYLIKKGADPIVVLNDGVIPTTSYALYCNTKQLDLLKEKGVDFIKRDQFGYNNVYHSLTEGNDKAAIWFLQNGLDYSNPEVDIFNYAMESGNKELLREILKHTEDININFENGATPAMLSLRYHDPQMFDEVLKMGASIEGSDNNGFTIIHYAASFSNTEILESLIDQVDEPFQVNKIGQSPLTSAMNSGNTETAIYLINSGDDVNQIDNDGNSPLMYAVQYNMIEVFLELCKKDPDFLQKNRDGRSLMEIAYDSENEQFADYLIKNKKDIFVDEISDFNGSGNQVDDILTKLEEVINSTADGSKYIKTLFDDILKKKRNGQIKFIFESKFQSDSIESIVFYPVSYSEAVIYFSPKSFDLYKTNPSVVLSQLIAELQRAMLFFEDSYFYIQVQKNPLEQFLFNDKKYQTQAQFIKSYLIPNDFKLTSMEKLLIDSFQNNDLQRFSELYNNLNRSIIYEMNGIYKGLGSTATEKLEAVNELGKKIFTEFSIDNKVNDEEKYLRTLKSLTFINIGPQIYFGIKEIENDNFSPETFKLEDNPEIFKVITDCQSNVIGNSEFIDNYINELNSKYFYIN